MYLVQMLLPLTDNDGQRLGGEPFAITRAELTERFGGVTAYLRAPARGTWVNDGEVVVDEVVMAEVMVETLERDFWARYRETLARRFRQETVLVRALPCDAL
jgi:hypothetical protein